VDPEILEDTERPEPPRAPEPPGVSESLRETEAPSKTEGAARPSPEDSRAAWQKLLGLGLHGASAPPPVSDSPELQEAVARARALLPVAAHHLVFDTETSGLSGRDCVLQLAYVIFDAKGQQLLAYNQLWKLPTGVDVGWGAYKVHKIGRARLAREGLDPQCEACAFMGVARVLNERGVRLVAHNAAFDLRMLNQTASNWGLKDKLSGDAAFCTYRAATPHMGLTAKNGRAKGPSNEALYRYFFGEAPTEILHDALGDVRVTARSYQEGILRGWW
jgi:DNA polymerase III epsilon subunit-like protein